VGDDDVGGAAGAGEVFAHEIASDATSTKHDDVSAARNPTT
jgi:hypothetical protein